MDSHISPESMHTRIRFSVVALITWSLAIATPSEAQESERPVPFDQAGRLLTISTSLASRLGLTMPQWPVVGTYVDARLYERPGGDFVIAVQKTDGTVVRYPITAAARRELSDVLSQAMLSSGLVTMAERGDMVSSPAGSRFVLSQLVAGLVIYGPAAAALADEGSAGALYLLTAGASFFAASAITKSRTVTRAQASLSTDGIWRGALLANGIRFVIAGDDTNNDPSNPGVNDRDRVTPLVTLIGALGGTVIGYNLGRNLTDAETAGATFGSTATAATTAGLLGLAGAYQGDGRAEVAALVGASLVGYPLGLRYVRRAPYRVTAGDVSTVLTTGLVGALMSSVLIPEDDPSGQLVGGVLTGGFLTGMVVGDRLIAKRRDLSESDAWLIRLGGLAGSLIGFALPAAFQSDNGRLILFSGSVGAALGVAGTLRFVR